ncbi:hypothetical protein GN956_G10730 [Arapaima gigas]
MELNNSAEELCSRSSLRIPTEELHYQVALSTARMETLQEAPTYRGDPGPAKLLLHVTTHHCWRGEETKCADLARGLQAKAEHAETVASGDESPFITMHEIQLSELDHVVDTEEETPLCRPAASKATATGGSRGSSTRQIHLSITARPTAINEPSGAREGDSGATRARDMSRDVVAGAARKAGARAGGRDASERSSAASSAPSDLDEADREVRSLTARSFRSLACPYLHGAGSSASALVDLRCDVASGERATSHAQPIGGLSFANIKAPRAAVLLLNGALSERARAPSSPDKAASRGRAGLVTLAETLHFHCNVRAGLPCGDRRAKFASNAGGSRSAERVSRRRAIMESAHARAMFASSLLKNVISKKMQFEQERRMERGEIEEPPCREHKAHGERIARRERGAQRRASSLSEGGSDVAPEGAEEPTDDVRAGDALTAASETNLEARNEAGLDTKKGALEASRGTLLRSQNSAFRSWKDGGVEFQTESKSDRTAPRSAPSSASAPGGTHVRVDGGGGPLVKMSHLYVPSIQVMCADAGVGGCPARDRAEEGRLQVHADSTLYLSSRSPEIKISLRSVKGGTCSPLDIAKLLAPSIGAGGAAGLARTVDDPKAALKGDGGDRVPQFTVRDVRESKSKLQTPIHQVRDVRKLVKSSYHFVSLDNNEEHRASKQGPRRNPAVASPIVIKCQSVNTNSNTKESGNLIEASKRRVPDVSEAQRRSPQVIVEGAKNGDRATGRGSLAPGKTLNGDSSALPVGVKMEAGAARQKQELGVEAHTANQAALEKLRAAVKTMEQLYVFDRNEWKRKTEPRRITDSHVLSLIASEEHGGAARAEPDEEEEEPGNADRSLRSGSGSDTERSPPVTPAAAPAREDGDVQKAAQVALGREDRDLPLSLHNKNVSSVSLSQKTPAAGGGSKTSQVYASRQLPPSVKSVPSKPVKPPLALKISSPRHEAEQREKPNGRDAEKLSATPFTPSATLDMENYLTIPIKGDTKPALAPEPPRGQTAMYTFTTGGGPGTRTEGRGTTGGRKGSVQSPERSAVAVETCSPDIPPATIYHHALPTAVQVSQPQVICLPPSAAPPPAVDPFQQTQRKMLLDPTTGHYYLVDTPVQPATRRLFDPETRQYVDVPMSQPPVTPLPVSFPPMALNPTGYGAAYMIYPGFLPAPAVVPARTVRSQPSEDSEGAQMQSGASYLEGLYYIPGGKSQQCQQVTTRGPKPIISITSQQGPRIIAPPSFDGTTMSFVVEHR